MGTDLALGINDTDLRAHCVIETQRCGAAGEAV